MKHSRSMPQKLTMEEIRENIVIIKINKSFREGMSKTELYDVTRGMLEEKDCQCGEGRICFSRSLWDCERSISDR